MTARQALVRAKLLHRVAKAKQDEAMAVLMSAQREQAQSALRLITSQQVLDSFSLIFEDLSGQDLVAMQTIRNAKAAEVRQRQMEHARAVRNTEDAQAALIEANTVTTGRERLVDNRRNTLLELVDRAEQTSMDEIAASRQGR